MTAFKKLMALFFVLASNFVYCSDDDSIQVVAFKDLDNYWLVKKRARPNTDLVERSKGGCAAIGMIIEADGRTSSHKVVGSFPDQAQDEMWVSVWKKTRYKPAASNQEKTPVYTVVTTGLFSRPKNDEQKRLAIKIRNICERKANVYLQQISQQFQRD